MHRSDFDSIIESMESRWRDTEKEREEEEGTIGDFIYIEKTQRRRVW
jgi:hypothetical protein